MQRPCYELGSSTGWTFIESLFNVAVPLSADLRHQRFTVITVHLHVLMLEIKSLLLRSFSLFAPPIAVPALCRDGIPSCLLPMDDR